LLQDTDGQVLLFGACMLLVLLAFILTVPNVTHATTEKVRVQTAADAGAFTGSIWLARALNLNASLNVGIKSVYTWMTVLTVGEALAQALYRDSLDLSVRLMGEQMTLALFGSSDPVAVSSLEYPGSIRKLDTTANWLSALQDDIVETFHDLAATLGTEEACRNAGAYPPSQTGGGRVITRTDDSLPLLVADAAGDSLIHAELTQIAAALDTIPTLDSNIGPAVGVATVDPTTCNIKASYGDSSNWRGLKQLLVGTFRVMQWYDPSVQEPVPGEAPESAYKFFNEDVPEQYLRYCGYSVSGQLTKRIDPAWNSWYAYGRQGYATPKPGDTVTLRSRHWKLYNDPTWTSDTGTAPTETIPDALPYIDSGYGIIWSGPDLGGIDFYTGAESTTGYLGPRVRVRRVNPDREFHTVSYVWRQGASTAPHGLVAPLGGLLFPRTEVSAPSPALTVARSEPYLATSVPTAYDYYFTPAWDVRLTPLDSLAVAEITSDTAYALHSRGCFDNMQDLREWALLP